MHKLKVFKKGTRVETKEVTQTKKNNVTREVTSVVTSWVTEYRITQETIREESLRKLGKV